MNYFDLHCDTLTACYDSKTSIKENKLHFSINNTKCFSKFYQTFAVFINEKYKGKKAFDRFIQIYRLFKSIDFENVVPILSIENAVCLNNDINNVKFFADNSVKIMSLTWNNENELGGGANSNVGLSIFGKRVVREMEKEGIILDVSHLSRQSFWDACKISTKPIIATHSNADAICNHNRNLTDEQIKAIVSTNGIIGINLYPPFITHKKKVSYDDLFFHIDHLLELGFEDNISLGTDFDGADMPNKWNNVSKMPKLHNKMKDKFGLNIANKIFFDNSKNFFDKYANLG